jgi:hydroxymethylbilane synthase
VLRIATRASALARWQAERVAARLGEPAALVLVTTTGDRDQRPDLHAIGGTGVFVKEVQQAVLDGRADLAVHSAKDLPSETPDGLSLAAVPERGDPRDALVGMRLEEIPTGGRVGTGSVRRRAQLAAARPDLVFAPLRGSIETRLRKRIDEGHDAVVVAVAALDRLGMRDDATEVLNTTVMLPQAAQGALAVECRVDDAVALEALRAIDTRVAHLEVLAERAYLAELGGGCTLPVGALAHADVTGQIVLEALLAATDGHIVLRARNTGTDPAEVGAAAARELLDAKGGRALLAADMSSGSG